MVFGGYSRESAWRSAQFVGWVCAIYGAVYAFIDLPTKLARNFGGETPSPWWIASGAVTTLVVVFFVYWGGAYWILRQKEKELLTSDVPFEELGDSESEALMLMATSVLDKLPRKVRNELVLIAGLCAKFRAIEDFCDRMNWLIRELKVLADELRKERSFSRRSISRSNDLFSRVANEVRNFKEANIDRINSLAKFAQVPHDLNQKTSDMISELDRISNNLNKISQSVAEDSEEEVDISQFTMIFKQHANEVVQLIEKIELLLKELGQSKTSCKETVNLVRKLFDKNKYGV